MDDKSVLIRQVNDGIALVAEDFTRRDPSTDTAWSFLCECGDGECAEWVVLQLALFRALRADGEAPVLAEGHVGRARATRAAKELVQQAEALRADAEQEVERARGLLNCD